MTDAVMITKITVGDINVQCGLMVGPREVQAVTPFQAGDDWLQNMTIYLFNRTARTIVAGGIRIGFPELGDGHVQAQPSYIISLGQMPAAAAFDGRTGKPNTQENRQPLTFAPGQTLTIHIGDYMNEIRDTIERRTSFSMVSNIFIYNGPFFFQDGMMYHAGGYSLPDSQHPGRFQRIPDGDYFPGDMRKHWPPGASNGR